MKQEEIILVDDDRNIVTSVRMLLECEGYIVRTFFNGEDALRSVVIQPADLMILDIKMPGMDGFETLKKLRSISALPVIFLTSKDEEEDEIEGLKLGADDYIKKPFSQKLLISRIKAILRRDGFVRPSTSNHEQIVSHGALKINLSRHECFWKNERVSVTVTEILILAALIAHVGKVMTRDQLVMVASGDINETDDRIIDSHIKRVRKKFREVDANFSCIETLYGVGYRYREE